MVSRSVSQRQVSQRKASRKPRLRVVKNVKLQVVTSEIDLSKYNPVYRECRDILHAWIILGIFAKDGEPIRKEKCVKCTTIKNRNISPGGKSTYQYPKDYKLPGVTRQQIRDYALSHAFVYESEEELLAVLAEAETKAKRKR